MKMEFNEGIARAWSNIGKENFDTLEFLYEDDEVNYTNIIQREINKTLV